jgi:nucleoid-associated protein YgaU
MIPEIAAPILPKMDVVRVAPDGSATVAGTAEAGARVSLRVDDGEAAFATADASGAYASLFTLPPFDAPRVLTVAALGASGALVLGTDSFVIAPIAAPQLAEAAPAPQAPETLKLDDSGVQVVSSADIANVTVESISYDGDIIRVGGRGAAGSIVRLYVDNADTASANITADGRFSANLAGVAPGTYTLRADQLDGAGAVTSRYEMTITKSAPEALAAAAAVPTVIEVAQGTTLWAIAQANFGDGLLYIQVYEANKDKIRDPDLIYPGQVFTIPALQ